METNNLKKFSCKFCSGSYDSEQGLLIHSRQHNLNAKDYYVEYYLDGEVPTCKCGCGKETTYLDTGRGFRDYIKGHYSRVHNNWGHNPEALRKSQETQKKKWENGEYEAWNKGMTFEEMYGEEGAKEVKEKIYTEERAQKISEANSGKELSEEEYKRLRKESDKYWSKRQNREKQRKRRIDYLKNKQFNEISNLEKGFKNLLDELNIHYIHQYKLNYYLYDFKIKDKDILIEVDGDFHHCNPDKYKEPLYEIQKDVIKNDKKKNKVAKENNFKLIRFWEQDIKNNIDEVKKELLSIIKSP